jgi:hypothetical protein
MTGRPLRREEMAAPGSSEHRQMITASKVPVILGLSKFSSARTPCGRRWLASGHPHRWRVTTSTGVTTSRTRWSPGGGARTPDGRPTAGRSPTPTPTCRSRTRPPWTAGPAAAAGSTSSNARPTATAAGGATPETRTPPPPTTPPRSSSRWASPESTKRQHRRAARRVRRPRDPPGPVGRRTCTA